MKVSLSLRMAGLRLPTPRIEAGKLQPVRSTIAQRLGQVRALLLLILPSELGGTHEMRWTKDDTRTLAIWAVVALVGIIIFRMCVEGH